MLNRNLCAVILIGGALTCGTAQASTVLDMTGLTGYSLIDVGNLSTYTLNSGPLAGNVLLGNHVQASFSGGNNGKITGTLYYDNTVTGTNTFNQLATPPTTAIVSTAVTMAAFNAATTLSSNASAATATQLAFGTISTPTTITGTSGLNVITIGSINNADITISGPSDAIFVFNVSGTFNSNKSVLLSGGVTASDLLWNLTGTSGNILNTSGAASLQGTFLATHGGSFQLDSASVNGEIINTAGNVAEVSGFTQTAQNDFVGFNATTPEPASFTLFAGAGLIGLGLLRRRKKA